MSFWQYLCLKINQTTQFIGPKIAVNSWFFNLIFAIWKTLKTWKDQTVKKKMVKSPQPLYWYFVNKICFGKNPLRISLVNNQQDVKARLLSNNLKWH